MGEKKRRLAGGATAAPRQADKLIGRAFEALQRGDRATAATVFETLAVASLADADALHAAGVLGLQLGDSVRAEPMLARAVATNPRDPVSRCHLAIAYRRLGKPELAIRELEHALALNPELAEAHANLGNLLRERQDNESAALSFARALAIRRDFPDALNGLGQTELTAGRYETACANFERAVTLDPAFHEAWYNLSRARTEWASALERASTDAIRPPAAIVNWELGLESILTALQLTDDQGTYWTQFESCVRHFDLRHPVDARVRDALSRALDHPAIDPSKLVRPIVSLATSQPGAGELQSDLTSGGSAEALASTTITAAVRTVLNDALLQRVLEQTVVPYPLIERVVAQSRRALLDECAGAIPAAASLPLPAIAAIAHQAFNSEYVYEESAAEREGVSALRIAIEGARAAAGPVPPHAYAIYACYRPLDSLDAAEGIAAELASTPLRPLVLRQIEEPREERRLRPTIAASTAILGEVSASVRTQYEANPYPRWRRVRRSAAAPSIAHFLRERFPDADLEGIAEGPPRILVAGCGTGRHPVSTALRFPGSTILAVDLSVTSLAYAKRQTQELAIGNIEYRQADILALESIAERFDAIECTGVLHHLEDPLAGWKILCSLLRPAGVMLIGLYSEVARRHVVRAREFIAARRFAATNDGIRACRTAILEQRDDDLLTRVVRGEDFYSLSGCRDLLFHVQEHRFTLPQIAELLDRLKLEFIGFEFADGAPAARYKDRYPDDRSATNLAHWHELETAAPDTFAAMYQFWVRRRD